MRAHVDPESGQLTSRPANSAESEAAGGALFSQDPTQVEAATAVDGSPMFILNGQFEMALQATVDDQGQLHLGCNQIEHQALDAEQHAQLHRAPNLDRSR